MISLDTNILARYLLNDSPARDDKAGKLLKLAISSQVQIAYGLCVNAKLALPVVVNTV